MTRKLFALEEMDQKVQDPIETQQELQEEVVEVLAEGAEQEEEAAEIQDMAEGVEEGIAAADEAEQVQEVVEKAEEQGGLDPVAAEAIRVAMKAIAGRVGASPKFLAVYAGENFQTASTRRANTQYALEGIGEFLADLWKRIKEAILKIVARVTEFFARLFANIERLSKTMQKMVEMFRKAGEAKVKTVEASTSVALAFPGKGELKIDEVNKALRRFDVVEAGNVLLTKVLAMTEAKSVADVAKAVEEQNLSFAFGSEKEPVAGGFFYSFSVKTEGEELVVESKAGKADVEAEIERQLVVPAADEMVALLRDAQTRLVIVARMKKAMEETQKSAKANFEAICKEAKSIEDKEQAAKAKAALKKFHKIFNAVVAERARVASLAVKVGRAIVVYGNNVAKAYA